MSAIPSRLKTIPLPNYIHASNFIKFNKLPLLNKLSQIRSEAITSKKLIFALNELEQLANNSPYAEIHIFKALFELAVLKPQNALETIRNAAKKRAEPQEFLRDFEEVICRFLGEKVKISLRKARNDCYSLIYKQDFESFECLNFLCEVFAIKRGVKSQNISELRWVREGGEEAKGEEEQVVEKQVEQKADEKVQKVKEVQKPLKKPIHDIPEAIEESFEPKYKNVQKRPASSYSQVSETLANPNAKNPHTRQIIREFEEIYQRKPIKNKTVEQLKVSDELKGIYGKKAIQKKYIDIIHEINHAVKGMQKPCEEDEFICQDFKSIFTVEEGITEYL